LQIVVAAFAGIALGFTVGADFTWMNEVGIGLLRLIKMVAIPLIFFAVMDAILHTQIDKRLASSFTLIVAVNAVSAVGIGLAIAHWLRPGDWLRAHSLNTSISESFKPVEGLEIREILKSLVPPNLAQPFLENSIAGVVIISLFFSIALKSLTRVDAEHAGVKIIGQIVSTCFHATQVALGYIIKLIPIAVFIVIWQTVGEKGFTPFVGLASYVIAILLGLIIQVTLPYFFWIRFVVGMPIKKFIQIAYEPFITALGTSSSLGALPVTLKTLDHHGIHKAASRLYAVVGTNLNNDGILLYEAMAVLVVAQAYGIEFTLGQEVTAMAACVIASLGIGGIPDAGLISLAVVLTTVGLPAEILPLLLSVDWFLSRARAATNVVADMTGSIYLDYELKKQKRTQE
jgi:DAACS family dicarboxylate/amino acid:cation (Na+ or H+) symporter